MKPPQLLGDAANRRALHARAVREDAHRQSIVGRALETDRTGLVVGTNLDPFERDVVTVEEITNRVARRRSCSAEHFDD